MKKIVLAFGFLSLFIIGPASAAIDFSVQNVSQDNLNAVRTGVRSGDVLRYELTVSGESLTENQITNVDLADVLSHSQMVNAGGGTLENNILSFPESFCLTCDGQTFSFFVRANETCTEGETLAVTFEEQTLSVPFQCDLTKSGPGGIIGAVVALFLILGYILLARREPC
jgi:hypothetical protein